MRNPAQYPGTTDLVRKERKETGERNLVEITRAKEEERVRKVFITLLKASAVKARVTEMIISDSVEIYVQVEFEVL